MLDGIETWVLSINVLVVLMFLGLLILSRLSKQKTKSPMKLTQVLACIFGMLLPSWMIYALRRPYEPFSIVVFVSLVMVFVGVLGLWVLGPLEDLDIFSQSSLAGKCLRALVVLAGYALTYGYTEIGFTYILLGILRPETVPLTPEFVRYALPTIVGSTIILYRLSRRFHHGPMILLGKISEDAIMVSFAMWAYVFIARYVGVETQRLFGFETPNLLAGSIVGLSGLGIEFWIHQTSLDMNLQKRTAEPDTWKFFSLKGIVVFFEERDRAKRQRQLDDFLAVPKIRRRRRRSRVVQKLDQKLHFRLFGRTIRGSQVLMIIVVVFVLPSLLYMQTSVEVRVKAPAYRVKTSIRKDVGQIPVLLSDQIEGKKLMSYAVPVVKVTILNDSFVVPLCSRHLNLNSSNYLVKRTGDYVVVILEMIPVEVAVRVPRMQQMSYDQLSNPSFEHFSMWRDAEIYYALKVSEYENVTVITTSSLIGLQTSETKIFYAVKNGYRVLIQATVQGETIKSDYTAISSRDEKTAERLTLCITRAKVGTSLSLMTEEPATPFIFLTS